MSSKQETNGVNAVLSSKDATSDDYMRNNSYSALLLLDRPSIESGTQGRVPPTVAKKAKVKKSNSIKISINDWGKEMHLNSLIDNLINILFKNLDPTSKYKEWLIENWRSSDILKNPEKIKLSRADRDTEVNYMARILSTFSKKFISTNNFSNNGSYIAITPDMKVDMMHYLSSMFEEMLEQTSPIMKGRVCMSSGREFKCVQLFFFGNKDQIIGNIRLNASHILCYIIGLFITNNPTVSSWYSAWCTSWITISPKIYTEEDYGAIDTRSTQDFPGLGTQVAIKMESKRASTYVTPELQSSKPVSKPKSPSIRNDEQQSYASKSYPTKPSTQNSIFVGVSSDEKDQIISRVMNEINDLFDRTDFLLDKIEEMKSDNKKLKSDNDELTRTLGLHDDRIGTIEFTM